ncbi:MAG: acyltransferase [Pseudomonadota bacterium]
MSLPRPLAHDPVLDGLRAVALLAVMLFHARAGFLPGGFLGVDVFFVLSGYLISGLILSELHATGHLLYRRFALRRLLRLGPALLGIVAVYLVAAPSVWPDYPGHFRDGVLALLWVSDISVALFGAPDFLGHTWSLAVEVHFYLIWPPLLVWTARRVSGANLWQVLLAGWLFLILMRLAMVAAGQNWTQMYYRFDSRLTGFVLGAAAAAFRAHGASCHTSRWLTRLPLIALPCIGFHWGDLRAMILGVPLVELATAAAILTTQGTAMRRWLAVPMLVGVGRISYGMYLWHYPVFRYLRDDLPWWAVLAIGLPVTVLFATVSFLTIERWGMRLRPASKANGAGSAGS